MSARPGRLPATAGLRIVFGLLVLHCGPVACGPGVTNVGSALEQRLVDGDLDRRTSEGTLAVASGVVLAAREGLGFAVTDAAINGQAGCTRRRDVGESTQEFIVDDCPGWHGFGRVQIVSTEGVVEFAATFSDFGPDGSSLTGALRLRRQPDAGGDAYLLQHDLSWTPDGFAQAVDISGEWSIRVTSDTLSPEPTTAITVDNDVRLAIAGQDYNVVATSLTYVDDDARCRTLADAGALRVEKDGGSVAVELEGCELRRSDGVNFKSDVGVAKWLLRFSDNLRATADGLTSLLESLVALR